MWPDVGIRLSQLHHTQLQLLSQALRALQRGKRCTCTSTLKSWPVVSRASTSSSMCLPVSSSGRIEGFNTSEEEAAGSMP